MPENVTVQQSPTENQDQAAINAQIAEQMNFRLNLNQPSPVANAPAQVEGEVQATAAQLETPVVVDPFTPFKEKFGYEKPEDAIKEIEELRVLKNTPPTPQPIKYENEESEKLHKAIVGNKRAEVYAILDKQEKIDRLITGEVTVQTAADIVKLGMQLEHKELTPDEINYSFNKRFAQPPKPTQRVDEEDTDFQSRISEWERVAEDKKMELMIEAKMSKPKLENAKSKLVLPDIDTAPVDAGYLEYQKSMEEAAKLQAQATAAYQSLTPKAIETKLNFNDEASKVAFVFQYEPDADGFKNAVDMVSDIEQFWRLFAKPDGTPDREKFLKFVHNGINLDKIVLEAMKQTKNATIKSMLPDNSQGGLVRQLTTQGQEPSELDKAMQLAGIRR
jgi:hypothetical protein